ncbi:MAG TPA: glycosyltransferase family 2 protein [Thermoanaerobaculia bacterium]|nr:glycosyltransferase family 2 protein [Thermoanaerobaculia bacterium]
MPATEGVSVVVPVYRNAATVAPLHDQLVPHASEIVFVVDGSPDDSLGAVLALQQRSGIVQVVALGKNAGQTWALLTGLRYASGDPIVMMDADLQDPPAAIPALVDALRDADVVFAGRRGAYESASRLLTSSVFKRMLSLASRGRIPPDAGLFLAMRREVAESLLHCADAEPYVISMLARGRWRMRSIPVARARTEGKSGYTFLRRVSVARRALRGLLLPPSRGAPIRTRVDAFPHVVHRRSS